MAISCAPVVLAHRVLRKLPCQGAYEQNKWGGHFMVGERWPQLDEEPIRGRRYVFLMDEEGRMRWRGSGKGEEEEVESLLRCTRGLLSGR